MTIDEAIEFEKEEIKGEIQLFDDGGSAWYHKQLVEWLEELKDYRDKNKMVVKVDVMNIQELKDKIPEAYEKGRADKYREIVSEYMLLTEKQVAEIRADTINECIVYMYEWKDRQDSLVQGIANKVIDNISNELIQLKEQNNDNNGID